MTSEVVLLCWLFLAAVFAACSELSYRQWRRVADKAYQGLIEAVRVNGELASKLREAETLADYWSGVATQVLEMEGHTEELRELREAAATYVTEVALARARGKATT